LNSGVCFLNGWLQPASRGFESKAQGHCDKYTGQSCTLPGLRQSPRTRTAKHLGHVLRIPCVHRYYLHRPLACDVHVGSSAAATLQKSKDTSLEAVARDMCLVMHDGYRDCTGEAGCGRCSTMPQEIPRSTPRNTPLQISRSARPTPRCRQPIHRKHDAPDLFNLVARLLP